MTPAIHAITLDLDDTLWPFPPIGERIERVLHAWFERHSPATAAMFPIPAMRELRRWLIERHPELAHDASTLRQRGIEHALRESGGDVALSGPAYAAFYDERNRVEFYDDAMEALQRLAARYPICALTNGNADLERIGIAHLFKGMVTARDFGAGKPDPAIYHHACDLLGAAPANVLHVGDDIELDVIGAQRAGLKTAWINRIDARWPDDARAPDFTFTTLSACADWLDTTHLAATGSP
ncbi:HAD family hydrolase [Solilutibacter silvestris]|uniref:HAD-SF-IA-v1: HAD hydrolase, family IA, variant 1 n=1 Tax=Solilutibacter silvestris TaxID=1645665 RepID=A0A2K1Q2E2_9GAMM|nr:HAD family hydrolase [Lysobacter silvestris]PNS09127.1 HAD-SF-IA-v1: HAD hydrolase, family IA, variant 1 [Lysobacter silvestris]